MIRNIVLCGVGGQGTVLASKLLAAAAMEKGYKVMSAETIGMAQRGGNVFSNIRISDGEDIFAPMIGHGEADLILGFEPGETVRMLPFLKKDGFVITNNRAIKPTTATLTAIKPTTATLTGSTYGAEPMLAYLRKVLDPEHLLVVDGDREAAKLGNPRVLNVVLLGAAVRTGATGLTEENVLSVMDKVVKERFVELNKKAFLLTGEEDSRED